MNSYAGIPARVLDNIKINLKYETCVNKLNPCNVAKDFWRDILKCQTLPVTAENLKLFSEQPDPEELYGPTIAVYEWLLIGCLATRLWTPNVRVSRHPKLMERALKVFLLWRYAPATFVSLGGKEPPGSYRF